MKVQNLESKLFEAYENQVAPVDKDQWPRDPSIYTPTDHFYNKFKDPIRGITGEEINKCITEGDLYPGYNEQSAVFRYAKHGIAFHLVVGNYNDDYKVVTGYPYVYDEHKAASEDSPFTKTEVRQMLRKTESFLCDEAVKDRLSGVGVHYSQSDLSFVS